MAVSDDDLTWLTQQGHLSQEQATGLRTALQARRGAARLVEPALRPAWSPRFDFLNVAYYFGALLVMGAMGFFMTLGWEAFGGGGIAAIAVAYAAAFVLAGRRLWYKHQLYVPGGLLITMAVAMVPLATYGIQRALNVWPDADPGNFREFHQWVKGGWFTMEIVTVLAAGAALRWFRFPFLVAPIAFCLWYMAMDATPLIAGANFTWLDRGWVSLGFGIATIASGVIAEKKVHRDFGFWLYLFGQLAFWGGLTTVAGWHEGHGWVTSGLRILLGGLGLAAVIGGTRTRHPVFTVFGVYAVLQYIGYLAWPEGPWQSAQAIIYGLVLCAVAFAGDTRRPKDPAGWVYLLGAFTLNMGIIALTFRHADEWRKGLFAVACLAFMLIAIILQRRIFLVIGALGMLAYIGRLATEIFADSLIFPFILSGIGIGIIALAVAYRRQHERLRTAIVSKLPPWLIERLPPLPS
ncbi:MAG: hypothetical protein H7338_07590 [Candidatus Sericytochromatia bacterium]|nr:hypothetical protein [Candidatus Sericytochromatia bacterium]